MSKIKNLYLIAIFILSLVISIISGYIQLNGLFTDYYELVTIICFLVGPILFIITNILINRINIFKNSINNTCANSLKSIYLPTALTSHFVILNLIVHLSITDMSKHWFLWLIPIPIFIFAIYTKLKAAYKFKYIVVYCLIGLVGAYYMYLFYIMMFSEGTY